MTYTSADVLRVQRRSNAEDRGNDWLAERGIDADVIAEDAAVLVECAREYGWSLDLLAATAWAGGLEIGLRLAEGQ